MADAPCAVLDAPPACCAVPNANACGWVPMLKAPDAPPLPSCTGALLLTPAASEESSRDGLSSSSATTASTGALAGAVLGPEPAVQLKMAAGSRLASAYTMSRPDIPVSETPPLHACSLI